MHQEINGNHEWLTVQELADFLHISRNTAYKYLRNGRIPSERLGPLYFIPKDRIFSGVPQEGNRT